MASSSPVCASSPLAAVADYNYSEQRFLQSHIRPYILHTYRKHVSSIFRELRNGVHVGKASPRRRNHRHGRCEAVLSFLSEAYLIQPLILADGQDVCSATRGGRSRNVRLSPFRLALLVCCSRWLRKQNLRLRPARSLSIPLDRIRRLPHNAASRRTRRIPLIGFDHLLRRGGSYRRMCQGVWPEHESGRDGSGPDERQGAGKEGV